MQENADQNNSEYEHFSRSAICRRNHRQLGYVWKNYRDNDSKCLRKENCMQEHLLKHFNSIGYNGFVKWIPTGGGLSQRFHFLGIMLRIVSEQPHIDLNDECDFTGFLCILGSWLDKYRLWTRNYDMVISSIFSPSFIRRFVL